MPVELPPDEDFEALLQESAGKTRRHISPGERVSGRVVYVGEKHATVDLGGGVEGLLDLAGTAGKDGKTSLKVGDTVNAFCLRYRDRVIELTASIGRGMANEAILREAAESGVPVDGTITGVNKGGYTVDVSGTEGFCPLGQMDVRRIEDPATLIGQRFKFRVTEFRGRDIVVSRRALLEAEQANRAINTRKLIQLGARLPGVVTNVRDFGAFVDLGGIEGMVPASELAWGRKRPQDVVEVGQQVEVEIIRIENGLDQKGRVVEKIGLSMRAIAKDPFEALVPYLTPGTILHGFVTRVEAFGAFVELIPGVEGLVHVSAFGKRISRPADIVAPNQEIAVLVQQVDPQVRRVSLAYIDETRLEEVLDPTAPAVPYQGPARILGKAKPKEQPAVSPDAQHADAMNLAPSVPRMVRPAINPGDIHEVTVEKVEAFGVFVGWEGGRGLVPNVELGIPHGTDARRSHPPGTRFRAVVQEVRSDGKVRLSKVGAQAAEERATASDFLAQQNLQLKRPKGGMGSLGEMLMEQLGKKK